MIRDYELCEEIHKGHENLVYRAVHKPTSKAVVVKVIPNSISRHNADRWHNHSEPEFYCRLKHDSIVHFYDCFIENDHDYLVMEYVDGFNLRQCIGKQCVGLTEQNARFNHHMNTALRICKGLAYLHKQKIIHGHIKPENILVSREVNGPDRFHNQVKIADFSMAGLVRGFFHPSPNIKGGTLRYMSPEQVKKKETTFRSDIFSLGVTLYELFTGRHPSERSASRKELLAKLLSTKNRPACPSELDSSLPRQLDQVIMKMLEKNQRKRMSTMAQAWLGLTNIRTTII